MTALGPNAGSAHITVKPSLRGWSAEVRRQLERESKDLPPMKLPAPDEKTVERHGARAGEKYAGGFDRVVRRRVAAALDALGKPQIGVATNEAEQKIKDLRAELATLNGQRIGVDIDAAAATARLEEIRGQLETLSTESADIQVKADTILAATQLGVVRAEVEALDGRDVDVRVDVDAGGAMGALAALSAATTGFRSRMVMTASTIGTVIAAMTSLIPLAAVLIGLTATLATTLVAAAGGAGILLAAVLGNILPVIKAQQELEQKQQQAATAARSYAAAQNAVASALAGLESAQISAARAIADAQRAVADARRNAARSVAAAEDGVRDAQERARDAQERLTEAREAARQRLADYTTQLRAARLEETGAALTVTQAQERLNEVLSDPTATQLQIDLARQALREAQFNYDQAGKRRKDLRAQAAEDRKAGVAGDEAVQDAREALADATEQVREAEVALAQARADGARAVANAERNLARARADGARAVAAAQQQVAQAQEAAAQAGRDLADAQAEVAERMAKLQGPAAVFVAALDRAKAAWRDFLAGTADSSFGLAAKALRLFSDLLPMLVPLANAAADAVGVLIDDFGRFAKGEEGQAFLRWMERRAPRAIVAIGRAIGNFSIGMAGLLDALSGVGDGFGDLMRRFANFGRNAGRNPTIRRFLAYIERTAPVVGDALAGIAAGLVAILEAAAPIGTTVLRILGDLGRLLADMDPEVLQVLVGAMAGMAAAMWLLSAAAAAAGLGLAGLIVLAAGAFITVWVLAYKKLDWFRKAVDTWFGAIADAAVFLWKRAIVPAFKGIARAVSWSWEKVIWPALRGWWAFTTKVLWPALKWLWEKIVRPVFGAIGSYVRAVWTRWIKPILQAWWHYLEKVLFPTLKWLWEKVVRPVFGAVGDKISDTWTRVIKPTLTAFRDFIRDTLVPAVRRGIDRIGEIWDGLKKAAGTPVKFVVDTVYNNGLRKVINAIPGVDDVKPVDTSSWPSFARGGVLPGWTPGRDVHRFVSPTAGVLNLSGGEGILIPQAVRQLGGEQGIAYLNRRARMGKLSLKPLLEQSHRTGGVVYIDGEPLSAVTAAQLAVAEWASKIPMRVMQGSYQAPSSYSGTSHTGGGVMDTSPGSFSAQSWLRKVAMAAWARNIPGAATAGSGAHVHSVSLIDPAAAGNSQAAAYRAGGDGLGGRDYGPRPAPVASLLERVRNLAGAGAGALQVGNISGNPLTRFLEAIDAVKDFAAKVPSMLAQLADMNAWGRMLRTGVRTMGGQFAGWTNDKIPGPGPFPRGLFDLGGLAAGAGYLPKRTIHPERVLSPAQTAAFERQVATLENWDRTVRALGLGRSSATPALQVIRFRIDDWAEGIGEMELMATHAAERVVADQADHDGRIADLDLEYA